MHLLQTTFTSKIWLISTVQYELSNRHSKNVSVGAPVWNVSVFGVFLFHIFPRLDWIPTRKTPYLDNFHAMSHLVIFQDFLSRVCIWINSRLWKQKIYRSSRPDASCEKDVIQNFSKFTGEHLCQSLFFNKVY